MLESAALSENTLGIRMSSAMIDTLIKLFDNSWTFADIGNISIDIDFVSNTISLALPLDTALKDEDGNILTDSKVTYGMALGGLNIQQKHNSYSRTCDKNDEQIVLPASLSENENNKRNYPCCTDYNNNYRRLVVLTLGSIIALRIQSC